MPSLRGPLVLFVIMLAVALVIGGAAIAMTYDRVSDAHRRLLADLVRVVGALVGAGERPGAEDVARIGDVLAGGVGFGSTGTLALAERQGERIVYWVGAGDGNARGPRTVPWPGDEASPMRRALSGETGTVIAEDHRGVTVLAAYRPLPDLELGLVATIDMSEVRAPFIEAAGMLALVAAGLIILVTFAYSAISANLNRRLLEGEGRFRELFNLLNSGAVVFQPVDGGRDFVFANVNKAANAIKGMGGQDVVGERYSAVFGGADDGGLHTALTRVWTTGTPEFLPTHAIESAGAETWREIHAYKLPSGELVALFRDVTARKRAEQAIRESEERFRSIAESANDAIVSLDSAGKVVSWNAAGERIFGYTAKEMLGRPIDNIVPKRYREAHKEGFGKAAASGTLLAFASAVEMEGRHKDGSEVPIELSVSTWTQGGARYFTGIIRDIAERKKAERALRDSEARMRSIIEMESVGIAIVDENQDIRFANRAASNLFGQPADRLIGAPFGFPLVDREVAEIEILRPNRGVAHAEMRAVPMRWHGRDQFLLFLQDVSLHKRTEGDLRKLFQAIEQSPVSVVITDVQGRIEYVNPKFTEISGYTYPEVVGKNPRILKSGTTPTHVYEELWRTISQGHVWSGELENKSKSGGFFWELASIAPVKDSRGNVTHYVAVKEDITARKATEDQLRQALKLEVVGQLTGGIAHDFNNLLGIILGNLQLLGEDASLTDEERELVEDAVWSAERGAELTHRLLAFARRQRLEPDVTDLNHVVREMMELVRRTLGEEIEVREHLAADLGNVMIDRGQLESALLNLVVNARDAMSEGGTLTIATATETVDAETSGTERELMPGEYAVLSVSDTGSGMPAEVRERIFEPFFTTKKFGHGSGLGLSMVYGFVRQSGGYVAVDSAEGEGTTFKLYLPRALDADPKRPDSRSGARPGAKGHEFILVVEDDDRVRKTAVNILTRKGYAVGEASSAAEALSLMERLPRLDLLFTDVVLPHGMNGSELAQQVRMRRPDIRILFTTGYAEDTVVRGGLVGQEADLLPKPYRPDDLASKVRDVLDREVA